MPGQKARSGSTEGRRRASEEAHLRMALRDLRRPIYSLDCIPVGGGLTFEEWKARRDADYDELYKDPAIPRDLIAANFEETRRSLG
jgi:hypothetical protein